MFYNENCLIPKIPPIPPGPDPGPDRVFHSVAFSIFCRARAGRVFLSEALSNFCRARAGPFPKGGTSKSPFIKGEPACQRLARNGATVPAHTAMAGRFREIFMFAQCNFYGALCNP